MVSLQTVFSIREILTIDLSTRHFRYPSDGGWYFHVVSSISEWVIATVFSFFILSFTNEFRDVSLSHPQIALMSYSTTI